MFVPRKVKMTYNLQWTFCAQKMNRVTLPPFQKKTQFFFEMEGVFIQRYTEKIQYISNEDPLNMQFSYEKNYICIRNAKAIWWSHFFAKNFCSHFSKESMFWACYETLVLFISGMH